MAGCHNNIRLLWKGEGVDCGGHLEIRANFYNRFLLGYRVFYLDA